MLTLSEDSETIQNINAGVSGYLIKNAGRYEFENAPKIIALGKKYNPIQ